MPNMILYAMFFGFFVLMIIFVSLDKHTTGTMIPDTTTELNDTNTAFSQNIKTSVNTISSAWSYIPLFALFGIIYFGFSKTQERS